VIVENRLGDLNGREHVGNQADGQRNRESANRASSKQKEEKGRDHRGYVRVDNRQKGFVESGLHGRCWLLAVAQLFANAFEHQHVGVNAHADGQNHASNAGQREHRTEVSECGKKNQQVQQQSDNRIGS